MGHEPMDSFDEHGTRERTEGTTEPDRDLSAPEDTVTDHVADDRADDDTEGTDTGGL